MLEIRGDKLSSYNDSVVSFLTVQSEWITFQVSACDDVIIYLTEDNKLSSNLDRFVELEISTTNQSVSLWEKGDSDRTVRTSVLLLSCSQFTENWLSWNDGVIKYGSGDLNVGVLLSKPFNNPFHIRFFIPSPGSSSQTVKFRTPTLNRMYAC